jgi:hypothetical protein
MMDMNMLAVTSGKERTLAEFDSLFAAAGLQRAHGARGQHDRDGDRRDPPDQVRAGAEAPALKSGFRFCRDGER